MEKYRNYLKSLIPFVAEAYTHVYGEEFKDIINKRLNNAIIIPYYDIEGLDNYLGFIKRCKRREYSIKFLEKIGLDVKEHKKNNYTERLDGKIVKILDNYISSSYSGFGNDTDYWVPLQAFKENNETYTKQLIRNKLKIINYLLGEEHEEITEENLESFTKTKEYQQILKKINELNIIYEELLVEYRKWEEQLKPYDDFIKYEQKRKKELIKKYKLLLIESIFSKLPTSVVNALSSKSLEEKGEALIGIDDIGYSSYIESFEDEQMEKLKSKDVELWEKDSIIWNQSRYFKKIGIDFPNEKMLRCDSEEYVKEYLEFISQDDIKQYIPSQDLITYVKSIREEKYKDAIFEYYITRKDFDEAIKKAIDIGLNIDYTYNIMENKSVCISGGGITRKDGEFASVMFYTIPVYAGGSLFHGFMHECGHIIDQSPKGCGFEYIHDYFENATKNSCDSKYRKHERLNETINDIFSIVGEEYWNNKGMYFIEPQEFTLLDKSDQNTAKLTKELLKPLLTKFKKQVIRAKIYVNHEELTRYIGEENFVELVDLINKVDYLTRNGVAAKIDTYPEDEMVKEYFEQVERINKIYSNIDKYYENYINQLYSDPYNYSKPRR